MTQNAIMNYLHQLERQCSILRHLQIYSSLNLTSPISIEGMLAFIKGLNLTPSCARYLGYTVKLWPSESPNKLTRTKIRSFSEETHLWDTLTSLKCSFMLSMHEARGMSLSSRPAWRKITSGSTVRFKWTRQICHLDSLNSSSRLNWGLLKRLHTYMTLSWWRNTTNSRTLDRINNIRHADSLRGRKILPEEEILLQLRDVSDMSISSCHITSTPLKLTWKKSDHANMTRGKIKRGHVAASSAWVKKRQAEWHCIQVKWVSKCNDQWKGKERHIF